MRATSIIFALFFLSPFIGRCEEDAIETPLRKSLTQLIYADDPLAEVRRPGVCADNTRAVRCANMSEEVDQDYADAKISLNRLRSQVSAALQRKEIQANPLLREEVRTVSQVLRCMHDKYDDLSIECTSNHKGKIGNKVGMTPLDVHAYITSHGSVKPNLITLGPSYFLHAKEKRPAMLIHELSHFCGTDDFEYYLHKWGPGKIPSTPFTQLERKGNFLTGYTYSGYAGSSAKNADNFALWVINGYCVPQFDCKD